jgi:hypothetical protein
MENQVNEVWSLRIYRPIIGKNPAGWYYVAAFLTSDAAQVALQKLHAAGRVTVDPKSITEENPNGNCFELQRLDVRTNG